jgi:hypothetical protein
MIPKVFDVEDSVASTIIGHLEATNRPVKNLPNFVDIQPIDFTTGAFEPIYAKWRQALTAIQAQHPGMLKKLI